MVTVPHNFRGSRQSSSCVFGFAQMRVLFLIPPVVASVFVSAWGAESARLVHSTSSVLLTASGDLLGVSSPSCDAPPIVWYHSLQSGETFTLHRARHSAENVYPLPGSRCGHIVLCSMLETIPVVVREQYFTVSDPRQEAVLLAAFGIECSGAESPLTTTWMFNRSRDPLYSRVLARLEPEGMYFIMEPTEDGLRMRYALYDVRDLSRKSEVVIPEYWDDQGECTFMFRGISPSFGEGGRVVAVRETALPSGEEFLRLLSLYPFSEVKRIKLDCLLGSQIREDCGAFFRSKDGRTIIVHSYKPRGLKTLSCRSLGTDKFEIELTDLFDASSEPADVGFVGGSNGLVFLIRLSSATLRVLQLRPGAAGHVIDLSLPYREGRIDVAEDGCRVLMFNNASRFSVWNVAFPNITVLGEFAIMTDVTGKVEVRKVEHEG